MSLTRDERWIRFVASIITVISVVCDVVFANRGTSIAALVHVRWRCCTGSCLGFGPPKQLNKDQCSGDLGRNSEGLHCRSGLLASNDNFKQWEEREGKRGERSMFEFTTRRRKSSKVDT